MLDKVSFGVRKIGRQRTFSYIEVDSDYNTLYSFSYPITHTEAMDMSRWATNRVECFDASVSLSCDGWYVYLDPNTVYEPESYFYAAHPTDRKNDEYITRYSDLINGYHSLHEPCV